MTTSTLTQVHNIRKEWSTVRSRMFLTCQKINELEEELSQTRALKRKLQQELISMEVSEKELLSQIQHIGKAKDTIKLKVGKAISASITEAFSVLSEEDKKSLVNSLLEEIL